MPFNTYSPDLVYDPASRRGVGGVVATVTDLVTGIPVTTYDENGAPRPVITNTQGYISTFWTDDTVTQILVSAGGVALPMTAQETIGAGVDAAIEARDAAVAAANLVGAPADTAVATLVNGASGTRTALDNRYPSKVAATGSVSGLMSAADKTKLDAATALATAGTIAVRGTGGRMTVGTPTATTDAVTKAYSESATNLLAGTIPVARLPLVTTALAGAMSATDKTNLDAPRLAYNTRLASETPDSYPTGYSTGLFGTANGWPGPGFRNVVTFSPPSYAAGAVQWAHPYQNTAPTLVRYAVSATVWGAWVEFANTDLVQNESLTNRSLSYRLTSHVNTTPNFVYHVAKVRTYGKFVPGIVEKHFAGYYEKTYTSGSFNPTAATLRTHEAETGGTLVVNSSAWADAGPMTGAVIKDGIVYQDFATTPKGRHALGVLKSGQFQIYQQGTNTAAAMAAAGVTDTFVYGPPLVRNGVKENMTSILAEWPEGADQRPRTLLGQSSTGDVIIVLIEGDRSPRLGANYNQCADLAVALGMHNGIIMDGGGSTQGVNSGAFFAYSSDASPRPVKESLVLHIPQGNPNNDDAPVWYTSTVAVGTGTLKYRRTNSGGEARLILRGNITGITAINATIFTLPPEFRPTDWVYETVGCVNGGLIQIAGIVVKSDGSVQITRKENTTWATADRYDFNVEIALN